MKKRTLNGGIVWIRKLTVSTQWMIELFPVQLSMVFENSGLSDMDTDATGKKTDVR